MNVNTFSTIASDFNNYPSEIFTRLSRIQSKRKLLRINGTKKSPEKHVESIDLIFAVKISNIKEAKKSDLCLRILDDYSDILNSILEDNQNGFYRASSSISSGLKEYNDNFLGIGNLPIRITGLVFGISGIISKKSNDAKKLKNLRVIISEAQPVINMMIDNIVSFLSSSEIQSLLKKEEGLLNKDYVTFLRENGYSISNDERYLDLKREMLYLKRQLAITIRGLEDLKTSHIALNDEINSNASLKESVPMFQDLFQDLRELNSNFQPLEILQ